MTALHGVASLAGFEARGAARTRWVTVGGLVFAAVAIAVTVSGLRSLATLGLAGAGAATDGLVHAALLLPPLIALLLGAGSIARHRESGLLAMVATQPVRRSSLPLAAFTGTTLASWAVVGAGLGLAAVVLASVATLADLTALAVVLGMALAATACAAALGVLVSSLASSHQQAVAVGAGLWLLLALGLDLLLVGVAPGLRLGPAALLGAVLVNPLEAARVLAVLLLDQSVALGPFGAYLTRAFGTGGAVTLLAATMAAWIVAPLAVASLLMRRRDI